VCAVPPSRDETTYLKKRKLFVCRAAYIRKMNHRFLFPREVEGRSAARGARERSSEGPSSS
jgi:hypothetical protein